MIIHQASCSCTTFLVESLVFWSGQCQSWFFSTARPIFSNQHIGFSKPTRWFFKTSPPDDQNQHRAFSPDDQNQHRAFLNHTLIFEPNMTDFFAGGPLVVAPPQPSLNTTILQCDQFHLPIFQPNTVSFSTIIHGAFTIPSRLVHHVFPPSTTSAFG